MPVVCETNHCPEAEQFFPGCKRTPLSIRWCDELGGQGKLWVAEANGFYWVYDGKEHIAATTPRRIYRFLYRTLANRLAYLKHSYLPKGIVPPLAGATAINFGANIGEVAILLAKRGMQVFAVEPDPYLLPALHANAKRFGFVVVPVAVWNENGPLQLYLKTDSADSSVFNVSDKAIIVKARTIDSIVSAFDLKHVGLIIGDAEGAEPEALEGAKQTLKITDYVSVRASAERNGESTQPACEAILCEAGFDIIYKEKDKFCTLIGRNRSTMSFAV